MNEFQKVIGSILLLLVLSSIIDKKFPPIKPYRTQQTQVLQKYDKQLNIRKFEDVLSDVNSSLKSEMSKEVDSFVEEELKKSAENGQISSQIINIISDKMKTKYFDPLDDLQGTLTPSDQDSQILYSDIPSHFNLDNSSSQYKSVSLPDTPSNEPRPRKSYNIDGQQYLNPCDPSDRFGFVNANSSFDNYAPF
jgi:hypothetical protein